LEQRIIGGVGVFKPVSHVKGIMPSRRMYTFEQIVTRSLKMQQLIQEARMAAASEKTLLITGETGTGKEMFAQSIHMASLRSGKKFVEVNCGAIPKDLIASELFGYTPGAFTGAASKGKSGKFVAADGGTLFLDEIGECLWKHKLTYCAFWKRKWWCPLAESIRYRSMSGSSPPPIGIWPKK
jgi:transcriptional regulator with PAS, ATPase and Fis domain